MTREEIEELKGLAASIGLYDDKNPCKRAVILGKAIKALEQEPCEDAVSRQFMYELGATCIATRNKNGKLIALGAIEELPPVTTQPKTGHWIEDEDEMKVWCSECCEENDGCSKYCPNCGAKMVERQESEEE